MSVDASPAPTETSTGKGSPQVTHVAASYPPCAGGVERCVRAITRELAASGTAVQVLTTTVGSDGAPRRELVDGVDVRRFRALHVAGSPVSPGLWWALLRLPRRSTVHVHVAHALVVEVVWLSAVMRGVRYVAQFHLDVAASGPLGFLLPVYKRFLMGPALRGADAVVALTQRSAASLVDLYRVRSRRVSVIGNGVDPRFAEVAAQRQKRDRAPAPLKVLFVGRLCAQKNVARLLRAAQLASALIDLVIVGSGDEEAMLVALASRLKLADVRFVGQCDEAGVARWMHWADLLACPSDNEGMPLVVLEALAARLPVLSTDVAELRQLIGSAGRVVARDDVSFAEALDDLATHPEVLKSMATTGMGSNWANRSWETVAAEFRSVYEAVNAT